MTIEEEYRLIRAAKNNDRDAQEALLNQFHNMLCGAAAYSGRIGFKEMYQVAALNFLESIRYFDTERDPPLRLMTYAKKCVHRRCADYRRRGNRVVTVPKYTAPTLVHEVRLALNALSYDQATPIKPGGFADEIVYKDQETVPESACKKIESDDLTKKLGKLSDKYRCVIERRMAGDQFQEIGDSWGVSKQAAEQASKRATQKLREMYDSEKEQNKEKTLSY